MKHWLMVALCATGALPGAADEPLLSEELAPAEGMSVFALSLGPASCLEWPGPGCDVKGLRFNLLAGRHREVRGIDFGTLVNWTDGDLDGLSVAGVGTWCAGATFGVHVASAVNYAEADVKGLQLALVNSAWGIDGLQLGCVNATSQGRGAQVGVWNMAESFRGIQIGLVNTAMSCSGVQLGLGNIIAESPLTACVIMNAWF